jgi:hypothetical protein
MAFLLVDEPWKNRWGNPEDAFPGQAKKGYGLGVVQALPARDLGRGQRRYGRMAAMTRTYLLFKCAGGVRLPLAVFSADNLDEAREAPTWLKRKHPERTGLILGPGEFFEIIEQGQCDPQDWEQAIATIGSPVPSRRAI